MIRYFAVIGAVLVGAMYAAEGYWGQPEPLKLSTDSYGLPNKKPVAVKSDVQILTVREAPAPDLPKIASELADKEQPKARVLADQEQPAASAPAEEPKKASKSAVAAKKRATKFVRKDSYDRYADWRDAESGIFR